MVVKRAFWVLLFGTFIMASWSEQILNLTAGAAGAAAALAAIAIAAVPT
jgi:hypothetical protein